MRYRNLHLTYDINCSDGQILNLKSPEHIVISKKRFKSLTSLTSPSSIQSSNKLAIIIIMKIVHKVHKKGYIVHNGSNRTIYQRRWTTIRNTHNAKLKFLNHSPSLMSTIPACTNCVFSSFHITSVLAV